MQQFREDACFTIYSLIADALYRCSVQTVATRTIVTIRSLSPSIMPSSSPMYLLSVANSGPGLKISELRNFFPQFRKSSCSLSSTQFGLRWGGAVRVLTADVGEKDFHHYEIVIRSNNGFEIIRLPRTEYETELDSGTVCEIIVTGSVRELVDFSRSICEKTTMLKLKNIALDFFLQGIDIDNSGNHMKGLRICDGTRAVGDFTAEELLCIGAVEYLSSCRCGFLEGSTADLRFRELVQVGKGHSGSVTKWSLDACVILIDVAMANEIFATVDPPTSVAAYFEDGCYTPAPVSVLKGLSNVKWSKYGLKLKDMQIVASGEVVIEFEEPRRISAMFIVLHVQHNSKTLQRLPSPAGERMVKVAAEACMKDLKARFGELFLSENGIRVSSGSVDRILHELQSFGNHFLQNCLSSLQKLATDVSECIANIIRFSPNEKFQEECASILELPLQNLADVQSTIRTKMFSIIQQQDGCKKRKPKANVTEMPTDENEEGPLFFNDEDDEPLDFNNEDDELPHSKHDGEEPEYYDSEGEELL